MSVLFAATHPKRTSALILYGAMARPAWAPDNPWGTRDEEHSTVLRLIEKHGEKAVRSKSTRQASPAMTNMCDGLDGTNAPPPAQERR